MFWNLKPKPFKNIEEKDTKCLVYKKLSVSSVMVYERENAIEFEIETLQFRDYLLMEIFHFIRQHSR